MSVLASLSPRLSFSLLCCSVYVLLVAWSPLSVSSYSRFSISFPLPFSFSKAPHTSQVSNQVFSQTMQIFLSLNRYISLPQFSFSFPSLFFYLHVSVYLFMMFVIMFCCAYRAICSRLISMAVGTSQELSSAQHSWGLPTFPVGVCCVVLVCVNKTKQVQKCHD